MPSRPSCQKPGATFAIDPVSCPQPSCHHWGQPWGLHAFLRPGKGGGLTLTTPPKILICNSCSGPTSWGGLNCAKRGLWQVQLYQGRGGTPELEQSPSRDPDPLAAHPWWRQGCGRRRTSPGGIYLRACLLRKDFAIATRDSTFGLDVVGSSNQGEKRSVPSPRRSLSLSGGAQGPPSFALNPSLGFLLFLPSLSPRSNARAASPASQ